MEAFSSMLPQILLNLSDKDVILFKKTYRNVTEQYYDNVSQQNADLIISLNNLVCETVFQKKDIDRLGLLSVLQILKIKGKNNSKLSESVQFTIDHLKNLSQKPLRFQTIQKCFKQTELFGIGCSFAILFYQKLLRSQGLDWKELITEIGKKPSINTDTSLQLLNIICKDNQGNAKHVVKSGFVKYIVSCYLEQKHQEKFLLYKALKFLKIVTNADRTIVRDRQKSLAKVVYTYDEYIPIIEQLCNKCYDDEYSSEVYKKNKYETQQIDATYVWSYNETFSKNLPQKNVNDLLKLTEKHEITPQIETKLYAILNNVTRFSTQNYPQIVANLPRSHKALFNYLKILSSSIENDPLAYSKINFSKLQKMVSDDQNPKSQTLFKYMKSLSVGDKSSIKVNRIDPKLLEVFCIDKNADILMEGAAKVPRNSEDLKIIKQILKKKQANNEFQADLLTSVKSKALESLSTALIDRKKLDLNSLLGQVDLTNIPILVKLLKLIEISLMMGHYQVEDFDKKRIFDIISKIEQNYHGEMIDWGSISQVIMIFQGQDAWLNHLNEVPQKCFWLLGCIEINEQELEMLFKKLLGVLSTIDKKSYKIGLIIGFIGRVLKRQQKTVAIKRLSQYFKIIQSCVKSQTNFKSHLYMSSLFLSSWHEKSASSLTNPIFQSIISPVHTYVLQNFKSTEHEYKYLEACLPFKFDTNKIVDNIDFLLSEYGSLASYVYKNSQPKPNVNYDKIANISNASQKASDSILQVLKFLKQNDNMIQGQEINKLLKKVLDSEQKYWQLYPNFVTIVNSILEIAAKTQNSTISKNLTQILLDVISHIQDNKQITPEQAKQILDQFVKTLKILSEKGTPLDLDRLQRTSNNIQNEEIKQEIKDILEGYKIQQRAPQPKKQNKSTRNIKVEPSFSKQPNAKDAQPIKAKQITLKQEKEGSVSSQKQISIPQFTQPKKPSAKQITVQKYSSDRNQMTTIQDTVGQAENKDSDREKDHLWIDDKEKNKIFEEINQLDSAEIDSKIEGQQMSIVQVLKKIKKMVEKKIPTTEFPQCVQIIQNTQLKPNQKDILGHLLVKYFDIDQDQDVLDLLCEKSKTNLSKQACYEIVSKHADAFILSDRWKFMGREWLEIAIKRMTQGYFSEACQVIEYNLIEMEDVEYFYDKKYHEKVVLNIHNVEDDQDAIFYMLLIGTSARHSDIKRYYIAQKIHLSIMTYVDRWQTNHRITSNCFYALSSLVYSQPEICLEIAKKQQQMRKMFDSFRQNYVSKAVVESGGCFIANMAYSNDDVKQVLRKYDLIEKIVFVFGKSLEDPEISTFKQLLRALGNLSLAQKCAIEIIDSGFCSLEVKMIEVFHMFVNLDETKLRLLKIAIDVFANLTSHKYNLPVMHKQQVTSSMIMLLETTQINPPIIMGCIDTVDGLCQNTDIEFYSVKDKKLPYILIDILKIQEDEKIIVKATRLLTNLTITPRNIQPILQANLLSVLANIVLPSFFSKYNQRTQLNYLSNNPTVSTPPNKKMQLYINKILTRIHNSKPPLSLLLKSGYLDCLVRTIETADNLEDSYIEILGSYAKGLPNFLNKRAFMCLIRVLTRRLKSKQTVEKCLKIFRTLLLRNYDRDEQDVVISDSPLMYEIMLQHYKYDTLYLLGLHCSMSKKLRKLIVSEQKKYNIIPAINELSQVEEYQQLANAVLFTIFNKEQGQKPSSQQPVQAQPEERAIKILSDGFMCELFRIDSSSKKAKIMLSDDKIVAFKVPDGQIKKKYTIYLKNLRDWQFDYQKSSKQWKLSVFNKNRGMFSSDVPAQKCATMIGGTTWGQIAYINIEFSSKEDKQKFNRCLSSIMFAHN